MTPKARAEPSNDRGMDAAVANIESAFGSGSIMKMGDDFRADVKRISTGVLSLDIALGGGLPLGRIVEIYGPESCLAWDTFIQYAVINADGNYKNKKGGTIENLYYRFHGLRRPGRTGRPPVTDPTDAFSAPSMNEEGRIFQNRIVDVVDTGRKHVWELRTSSGAVLRASAEHKFFIGTGYRELCDLSPGDQVWIHNSTPFMVAPEDRALSPRPTTMVKHHPNGHDKFVGIYRYRRLQRSHIAYEAAMNGLDFEVYVKQLNTGNLDGLQFLPPGIHIHHIDEDWANDDPTNLLPITPQAHGRHHATESHNNLRYMVVPDEIVSLTPCGDQQTFDIRMETPHNNYIANGLVVHNSGKSTLALCLVAEAQGEGLNCAYIDAEHALDPVYAQAVGVNKDDLYLAQPDNGEQALEIVDKLCIPDAADVIIIDSVAALTPRAELEGDMGDAHVGLQARMMSQALRKLNGVAARNGVILYFINQLREKIGVMYGSPEVTPGGRALKFYSSVRLDVRRIETVKDGAVATSNKTRVKVVKNKVASPYTQTEFEIEFGLGPDKIKDLIDLGVRCGAINKSGAWYTTPEGEQLGQGLVKTKEHLQESPALLAEVRAKVIGAYLT